MPEEAVARLSGVTHRYGAVVALEEVDLEVRRGEVLAVLGPNGAGKTTAISLLLGSVAVQTGEATVFAQRPGAPEVRARRGAMLQISGVPETLTVGEHIDLFRAYYPAPVSASRLLAMAGLEGLERRRFGKLSGGQKQRVMFALALCGDPQLVFLDEPTAGLDVEARRGLWDEIRALSESGRTTVLTTHYLEEADALADRIVVLHRGRVIAEGSPATIKSHTAARRVRCVTGVHRDRVASLPGVVRSETRGRYLEILTARPEDLVRALLDLDPDLHDLTVVGAGLEEAFLALTRAPDASEPVS
ncbi:MAG: ABC transporter ATP-binding protein [Gemmatimonadales bacterium]|nr:ABC transporter ATP-binding protein [Gemmatimonadales bacterium]MYG48467.1 ABC transporter ATP-binding protein [Gemmatimonadales bacterium]MYK00654.1 ABC transporter ATP-binding protein [Candidatus Palauibacter ramosifaciens]